MRSPQTQLLFGFLGLTTFVGGCGWPDDGSGTPSDDNHYFSVSVSAFVGSRAIPLNENEVGSEWTEVQLPQDLMATAPADAKLTLNAPDVGVAVAANDGFVSAASLLSERRIAVSFRLGPRGSDPCQSAIEVGPFELTVMNESITIPHEWRELVSAARDVADRGSFSICARAEGDFNGAIELRKFSFEFGALKPGEKKVEICHIPPGDPISQHTIIVGSSAVDAHLAHADYLGACVVPVADLGLSPACSTDPTTMRSWIVNNPNTLDADVTWEVDGTAQTGTFLAAPGETSFETQADIGLNAVTIRWFDEQNVKQSVTSDSTDEQCAPDSDTDGDGVGDSTDVCPGTPPSEKPDASGCSCSQRDADTDGVSNCDDDCADTVVGAPVDQAGCSCDQVDCSCDQVDTDGDGVNNCYDLCPTTPAGAHVDLSGCETIVTNAGADITIEELGCVTLQGTASGGTEPYTYSWSADGWESSTLQTPSVVPTATTTYTLTVTDWSTPPGSSSDTVTITIEPPIRRQYTIENLGTLSSNPSYPSGINSAGDVVGYYYSDDWNKRAFLYRQGAMIDLGTLGGSESYARDINDTGQVVGQAKNTDGAWRAFLWTEAGGMVDLGTLGGASSAAYAINEAGDVVGNADALTGSHAFRYRNGTMSDVGTLEYFQSGSFDINDSGQVVGTYLAWGHDQQGFSFDDTFVDLGSLMLSGTRVVGINDAGLMIGYSWGLGEYRSFLRACGEVIDLGMVEGFTRTYAWGVNNAGQIVASITTADASLSHAAVFTGGTLLDLNDLLLDQGEWEFLTAAFAVNDIGQIAGYGRIGGQYRAFLLSPTN